MMSKFERKYGKYAISNLSLYLVIGYVVGYLLEIISPNIYGLLTFNPYMITHGQVWRLVTWLLVPPEDLGLLTIIMLILYYQLGQGLEHTWGTYRYNLYMFSGFIFTVVGALAMYGILVVLYRTDVLPVTMIKEMYEYGYIEMNRYFGDIISLFVSTYYINMSIFLAYAVTYPEEQLYFYFVIPIKMKWFAIVYGLYIIGDIATAFKYSSKIIGITVTVLVVASLLNFLIYMIVGKNRNRFNPNQVKRRHEYKKSIKSAKPVSYENGARHKCAVCGRTELDSPELTFRYCSKCSGSKEYCEDHLFTHTHN